MARTTQRGPQGGQYHPLTLDRIGRIHETSLRVLEEIGVKVELDEAREVFASGGLRQTKQARL